MPSVHALVAVFLLALASSVGAQTPADACAADKVEAAGDYMDAVLDCQRRDANGEGPAAKCVLRASSKLYAAFASVEKRGGCAVVGDAATVVSNVNVSVTGLMDLLDASGQAQCMKHLVTAMSTEAKAQTACYAEAVTRGAGHSVDSACQASASQRFFKTFDHIAGQWDCGTVDAHALDAAIRQAASAARSAVALPTATCAPIEITAVHGASFNGNSRLARIENGRVACLHVDTASPASCAFSTVAGRQSGEWLESPSGPFALVGQSLRLDGTPGGDYIVAASVSSTAPAACLEPTSMDTLGAVMEGYELARDCTVEEPLAEHNALSTIYPFWSPIYNYADREVCSANDPASTVFRHPDEAVLTRSYSSTGSGPDDTFCYTGFSAALNDLNGTERDQYGNYFIGAAHCHVMNNGGFEVPAAKRPATFSFPVPRINARSRIAWRPVNPHVVIANGGLAPPVQQFDNRSGFQAVTGAQANTVMPDLGVVGGSVTIGSITFSLAPGGDTLAVGAEGTPATPDWYPPLPGNDVALGWENLQLQFATPVYALGFEFVEPNVTMPSFGGTPVDSTFEIVMYHGAREVGRTTFNANDDEVGFVGVWSNQPFDRVTIVDLSGNDDDEFFGRFYVGNTQKPF